MSHTQKLKKSNLVTI